MTELHCAPGNPGIARHGDCHPVRAEDAEGLLGLARELADELDAALPAAAALGHPLVIEELLEGPEVSVFALCDGVNAVPLPAVQDFKRAFDGDEGPNTGGMGSYSPAPDVDVNELVDAIHRPVLAELARRDAPFLGALFAGVMLTESGPRGLEVNCRLGDPETQSLLPRLGGKFLDALA